MKFKRFLCKLIGHTWELERHIGIMLAGITGIVCTGRKELCKRCYVQRIRGVIP